jgi:hypothetical protein
MNQILLESQEGVFYLTPPTLSKVFMLSSTALQYIQNIKTLQCFLSPLYYRSFSNWPLILQNCQSSICQPNQTPLLSFYYLLLASYLCIHCSSTFLKFIQSNSKLLFLSNSSICNFSA